LTKSIHGTTGSRGGGASRRSIIHQPAFFAPIGQALASLKQEAGVLGFRPLAKLGLWPYLIGVVTFNATLVSQNKYITAFATILPLAFTITATT
jgi:hypothetical protein